jgi:hypothetical protein
VALVITGDGPVTTNETLLLGLVPQELVAVIATPKVPQVVIVPLISPFDVFTLNPVGKPVAPKLVGLPDAVI